MLSQLKLMGWSSVMVSGFFSAKDQRCVFIHVPKTAGASVSSSLDVTGFGHLSIKWFPKRYFSCSFVRNPWDRVVSAFFYLNQGGENIVDQFNNWWYLSSYKGDFTSFVKEEFGKEKPAIFKEMHFKPQHKYICDKRNRLAIDFLGRYENLEEDFQRLSGKLEFSTNKLPHLHESCHEDYQKYYSNRTRKMVAQAYKKDIELFDYNF